MRSVNIALLVMAGALSGALVMKMVQHPARVAARPVTQPAANLPQTPAEPPAPMVKSQPAEIAETAPQPALPQPTAAPTVSAPASQPDATSRPLLVKRERSHFSARSSVRSAERKPSPLGRVSPPAMVAASPEPRHTPPHRVELQQPPAAGESAAPAAKPAAPPSPPVLPEQPKETPPARREPENVTPAFAPIESAPEPNQATLNAGMLIPVRLVDSLSAERNQAGDVFAATLYRELVASGFVIAERGARVEGRVTAVDRNAHTITLELISVHTSDNQDVPLQTDRFEKRSEPDRSGAAAKIGAGDVRLSRKAALLAPETRMTFSLRAPVTITERSQ